MDPSELSPVFSKINYIFKNLRLKLRGQPIKSGVMTHVHYEFKNGMRHRKN